MKWARTFDWLTFTSHEPPRWKGAVQRITSPVRFYKTALKYECGTIASYGNPNSDKWLVSMSSKACENRNLTSVPFARTFISERIDAGCKFSRVDMAITVQHEGELTVDTVREWVKAGQLIGPDHRIGYAKTIVNDVSERGETLYIGEMERRAKRGIVRVYDKSLEMGEEPGTITRFEVEEKRDVAHTIALKFRDGATIGSLVLSRLDFDNETWRILTGGEIAPDWRYKPPQQEMPLDKTWLWLIERIAPVLGRKIAIDEEFGTGSYTRAFFDAVTRSTHAEKLTMNQNDDNV